MGKAIRARAHCIVKACLALLLAAGTWDTAMADGRDDERPRHDLGVIGLTDDGRLVSFRVRSPHRTKDLGHVSGLTGSDTGIVGIDFRVQDGQLYGVGDGGGVYRIDPRTTEATLVNRLTVPLAGTAFGVDFNPEADRLRIVSDAGQNLAHNVNHGGVTVANATLTHTAAPAAPVAALGVTAAAYTNNDLNPNTATTLVDLDTMLDQVVIQSPPANGFLVATGKLGADASTHAGFDIYTLFSHGVAVGNFPFATLSVNGRHRLYSVNLTTGQAFSLGRLGEAVVDIAIPLAQ